MNRLAIALTALCATTVGLAQQQPPPSQAPQQPPASTSQPTTLSQADRDALMKDCLEKIQAANPQASQEDVKAYCDKKVQEYASPKNQ